MARRKSWLQRLNPVSWLENLIKAVTPAPSRPSRRRARRPPAPAVSREPRFPVQETAGAGLSDREFRSAWEDEGGQGSYRRARSFFDNLPTAYDDEDEQEDTWRAFVRYMVNTESGFKRQDPQNPFWSAMGMSPRDFDWSGWRAAVFGGRHRTP